MKDKEIPDLADRRVEFGSVLRKKLEELGFTQARLSELTGISTALIYKYCNNKSQPSAINFLKISDALGMAPDEFYPAYYQVLLKSIGLTQSNSQSGSRNYEDIVRALEAEVEYWKEKYYQVTSDRGKEQDINITPTEIGILKKYEKLELKYKMTVNRILLNQSDNPDKWDDIEDSYEYYLKSNLTSPKTYVKVGHSEDIDPNYKRLAKALLLLSKSEQLLISLYHFDERTISDISHLLSMKEDEVEAAIEKATTKLRHEMNTTI